MSQDEKDDAEEEIEAVKFAMTESDEVFGYPIFKIVEDERIESEIIGYSPGPCKTSSVENKYHYFVYKQLMARIKVVGFKGYYIEGADILNANDEKVAEYVKDGTEFIGDKKENISDKISILTNNISSNNILSEIRNRFEINAVPVGDVKGFYKNIDGHLTYWVRCYGTAETNNNPYIQEDTNSFLDKLYDQKQEISKEKFSIYSKVNGNYTGSYSIGQAWIEAFNSREYDPIYSNEIKANEVKYNGERLSIAKVNYTNYFLLFNGKGKKLTSNYSHLYKNYNTSDELAEKESKYKEAVGKLNITDESELNKIINDEIYYNKELSIRCSNLGPGAGECVEGFETAIEELKNAKSDLDTYISENYAGYNIEEKTKNVVSYTNTAGVNILNPATMDTPELKSSKELISHTIENEKVYNLQVGVPSTVTPKLAASDEVYGNELTNKERKSYIKYYLYLFNFPVESYDKTDKGWYVKKLEVNNRASDDESLLDTAGALTFTPTGTNTIKNGTSYNTSQVNIDVDKIRVIAVTKNVPSIEEAINIVLEKVGEKKNEYFTISKMVCGDKNNKVTNNNKFKLLVDLKYKIRYDAAYISEASKSLSTTNISRLYGFRITDCSDVNFKDVFRKTDSKGVNQNTGVIYFSGIKELDVFTNSYKLISNTKATLPLGPYKHTNNTYVEAPKLGYKISFDLKTSGYYRGYLQEQTDQSRKIVILPRFYYISKDGKNFVEDVDAYYKNASGKYVKISLATKEQVKSSQIYKDIANGKSSFSGYEISFIPNDGYRNVLNLGITAVQDFFKSEKKILDTSSIVLTHDMMCTNYDGFVQSWYGEYKIPNSTILVRAGETNLNNKLQDGYIGVIFYVGVVEKTSGRDIVISYNTSDKNSSSQTNTTQWDYEGYLGFSTPGLALSGNLSIQLARGKWNINNDTYQKIKGTVVLFDLDNRASSDFD